MHYPSSISMYKGLRLSTMTMNGRHYTTSLTTSFFLTAYSTSTDIPYRCSFIHVLPIIIPNPIPSKFRPRSSSTASAFSQEKWDTGHGLGCRGGGSRRTCRLGHLGTKRLKERYPVEKEMKTHVSFSDQIWAGVSPRKKKSKSGAPR